MAVIFENARFDPDLTEFHGLAKQMTARFGYEAQLAVDAQLAQLLRLRVAQLNPCSYCLILHTKAAKGRGIAAAKIVHLSAWHESTMFSDAERFALAYCEALTTYDLTRFSAHHQAMTSHFEQAVIAEIAAIVINMNVWTRLKLAQGAVPVEG